MDAKEIGLRLQKLRGDRSQEEVAKACKISKSAISMYEQGERIPRDSVKLALAAYYKKSVESLFLAKIVTKRD